MLCLKSCHRWAETSAHSLILLLLLEAFWLRLVPESFSMTPFTTHPHIVSHCDPLQIFCSRTSIPFTPPPHPSPSQPSERQMCKQKLNVLTNVNVSSLMTVRLSSLSVCLTGSEKAIRQRGGRGGRADESALMKENMVWLVTGSHKAKVVVAITNCLHGIVRKIKLEDNQAPIHQNYAFPFLWWRELRHLSFQKFLQNKQTYRDKLSLMKLNQQQGLCGVFWWTTTRILFQSKSPDATVNPPVSLQTGPPAAWWACVRPSGPCKGRWCDRKLWTGGSWPI